MALSFGEILGLVAGAITTGSFVPQVIRVYKIKSAHEISLGFIVAFVVGDSAWLAYGIITHQLPVILWNVLAVIMAIILLIGKIKYGKHPLDPGFVDPAAARTSELSNKGRKSQ